MARSVVSARYEPQDRADVQEFINRAVVNDGWGLDGAMLSAMYKEVESKLGPIVRESRRLKSFRVICKGLWWTVPIIRQRARETEPRA